MDALFILFSTLLVLFISAEFVTPAHPWRRTAGFIWRFCAFGSVNALIFNAALATIYTVDFGLIDLPESIGGLAVLYFAYSFVAYWSHRIKHEVSIIWRTVHWDHHAPQHMGPEVSLYRHPIELIVNTFVIFILTQIVFSVSPQMVLALVLFEGLFELWHHSNTRTPLILSRLGVHYVFQTPEMHLIHHQRGVHSFNFGTVSLWDHIFKTAAVPAIKFNSQLGFDRY